MDLEYISWNHRSSAKQCLVKQMKCVVVPICDCKGAAIVESFAFVQVRHSTMGRICFFFEVGP